VLDALRGEQSIATLCRREGIVDMAEKAKRIGNSEVLPVPPAFT